jgi:uncharacterized protein YciW
VRFRVAEDYRTPGGAGAGSRTAPGTVLAPTWRLSAILDFVEAVTRDPQAPPPLPQIEALHDVGFDIEGIRRLARVVAMARYGAAFVILRRRG